MFALRFAAGSSFTVLPSARAISSSKSVHVFALSDSCRINLATDDVSSTFSLDVVLATMACRSCFCRSSVSSENISSSNSSTEMFVTGTTFPLLSTSTYDSLTESTIVCHICGSFLANLIVCCVKRDRMFCTIIESYLLRATGLCVDE